MMLVSVRHIAISVPLLFLTSVTAHAMDDCLQGWWEADYATMAEQFKATMQASSVSVSGGAYLRLADEASGEYVVNDLQLEPVIPGAPAMTVTLNGGGQFNMAAEDGSFSATMGVFSYSAKAQSPAFGVMEIPFDSANSPFGGGAGSYSCAGEILEFTEEPDSGPADRIIQRWNRLPGDPR